MNLIACAAFGRAPSVHVARCSRCWPYCVGQAQWPVQHARMSADTASHVMSCTVLYRTGKSLVKGLVLSGHCTCTTSPCQPMFVQAHDMFVSTHGSMNLESTTEVVDPARSPTGWRPPYTARGKAVHPGENPSNSTDAVPRGWAAHCLRF